MNSRTAIVSWDDTTRPANLDTLKFKLPTGARLAKLPDGLYLKRGLIVSLFRHESAVAVRGVLW